MVAALHNAGGRDQGELGVVKVMSLNTGKKRIALTMKGVPQQN